MKKKLSKKQTSYFMFEMGLDWNKSECIDSIQNDKWEITDNKSDDKKFPYIVLRNGKYFDAITEEFKKEIINI